MPASSIAMMFSRVPCFDELALGAEALDDPDELEFEEHHRVDAGPAPFGVEVARSLADEAEVQLGFEVAVEVAPRDQVLQRDGDRRIEAVGLERAEHVAPFFPRGRCGRSSACPIRTS
jgi:hypothetical protein